MEDHGGKISAENNNDGGGATNSFSSRLISFVALDLLEVHNEAAFN
jgi:hypothetical protein